jgi:hypothetical protein
MLPLKSAISDTYPNPSNAVARAGFAQLWDAINEISQKSELDLASAATCDIGGQASTKLRITGTTGITSFGTNYRGPILIRWAGAVSITHNATTLRCPGGASYTTIANEVGMAWPIASVSGTIDGWQYATLSGGSLIGAAAITSGTITGITDLLIADGGTGASSAAAAFNNLKQAASTTATGVVELATDAEAQAGTDATRCVTPDNLGAVVLGLGQTYQNVTASRAIGGGPYTNSSGRSISLSINCLISAADAYLNILVGGSTVGFSTQSYGTNKAVTIANFIVPPGATYQVTASAGTTSGLTWNELR